MLRVSKSAGTVILYLTFLLCQLCYSARGSALLIRSRLRTFKTYLNDIFENRLTDTTGMLLNSAKILEIPQPWNAPKWVWKSAWDLQNALLPILHRFDRCHQKDSFVNLSVLWWKAIAGSRWGSLTFDGFTASDLLPSFTRWIVGFPLCWLYPRLHHQNVALRTAYLDRALVSELDYIATNATSVGLAAAATSPKIITLGAGFDTRSLRFLKTKLYVSSKGKLSEVGEMCRRAAEFYEIDLPSVVQQKRLVLQRYLKRQQQGKRSSDSDSSSGEKLPKLLEGDLNDIEGVRAQLRSIFDSRNLSDAPKQPTIFLVEAVLLYLQPDNVLPLLQMCTDEAATHSSSVSLVFADRFPGIETSDGNPLLEQKSAEEVLQRIGLRLCKWLTKPGKARQMGVARLQRLESFSTVQGLSS